MISIITCHKDEGHLKDFKKSVADTIGDVEHEVVVIDNRKSEYYLTGAYNEGVRCSKGEFLVFVHEDVRFLTENWGPKLIDIFENTEEIGLLGLAGADILLQNAQWWFPGSDHMYGEVTHESGGAIWKSVFSEGEGEKEVVVLDGVLIACRKSVLEQEGITWDEDFDNFHYYDISFCIPFLLKGYKNYVTYNLAIKHFGLGAITPEWEHYRHVFVHKFFDLLPIRVNENTDFNGERKQWKTEIIKEA